MPTELNQEHFNTVKPRRLDQTLKFFGFIREIDTDSIFVQDAAYTTLMSLSWLFSTHPGKYRHRTYE